MNSDQQQYIRPSLEFTSADPESMLLPVVASVTVAIAGDVPLIKRARGQAACREGGRNIVNNYVNKYGCLLPGDSCGLVVAEPVN